MSWFHRHKWKAAGVNHLNVTSTGYFNGGVWYPLDKPTNRQCTEVLFRCECQDVKTQRLEGIWSLEEISGPIDDKQFLKEAGVKI